MTKVNIEIDGKKIDAEQGSMIIEAADNHDVYIPRFCYHKKLSIAANCRMCLVEIEGGRKAMPACATPISEGMKIKTHSELACKSQKAVMEFLLINHPLDCPICDQGGQCELQDLAMGYGKDTSRYIDRKRVVKDKNLGPLINTDMTRCILCTRCVRFGREVAGLPELGTIGRGEHTEISTFVEQAVMSEVSGNIIDLCPVGALTSKPFRYSARAWELQQRPSIAAHDCLGSNIYVHSIHNQVKRVVPRTNEAINESWLSDRDRFSYVGLNSEQRVSKPLLKKDGQWQEVDWTVALETVSSNFKHIKQAYGAQTIAGLISPSSTVEEQFLLQKLLREFGCHSIDHRYREIDFSDQENLPVLPELGLPIADLEKLHKILLIGSDIQHEQPLAAIRLLKACKHGCEAMLLNTNDYDFHFSIATKVIASMDKVLNSLKAIVKVLAKDKSVSESVLELVNDAQVSESEQIIADKLSTGEKKAIILGAVAQNSSIASELRYFANVIAELVGASVGVLTYGANAAGAWLTGCVPHRGVAGTSVSEIGFDAQAMFIEQQKAYLFFNVEPESDCANTENVLNALQSADFIVCCSPFVSDKMREYADVILPIVPFTETSGTFVNCNNIWQSFNACVMPLGNARPGWKVLRVLANFLGLPDFEYTRSEYIRNEVQSIVDNGQKAKRENKYFPDKSKVNGKFTAINCKAFYQCDNIVRRSKPLQEMAELIMSGNVDKR